MPFDPPEAPVFRCPSCGASTPADAATCPQCGSHLATRRCLRCFVLNPVSAERCTRCGALLPQEALEARAAGKCPDCRLDLTLRAFGAVGYSECPRCGGLFLGQKAFEAVTRDADTRARVRAEKPFVVIRGKNEKLPPARYRPCPECKKLMNRVNYSGGSGIIVDSCGAHGVWFDRGELTAIVDFLEGGGFEKLRLRERERLRDEVAALESQKRFGESISLPASGSEGQLEALGGIGDLISFLGSLFRGRG